MNAVHWALFSSSINLKRCRELLKLITLDKVRYHICEWWSYWYVRESVSRIFLEGQKEIEKIIGHDITFHSCAPLMRIILNELHAAVISESSQG
jgi:hypothetical protein